MEHIDRNTCVGCGIASPATKTDFTLIGARHGWRISKRIATDGTIVMEWRCPACWAVYRSTSHEDAPLSSRPSSAGAARPSSPRPAIVLVGEDRLGRETLVRELARSGYRVRAVAPPGLLEALDARTTIVVVDIKSSNEELLDAIDERCPTCRVIVHTHAVVALRQDRRARYEVIPRDAPIEDLDAAIKRATTAEGS